MTRQVIVSVTNMDLFISAVCYINTMHVATCVVPSERQGLDGPSRHWPVFRRLRYVDSCRLRYTTATANPARNKMKNL